MNRIFNVINKNNNERYEVFDIVYNNAGYPHFLIYKDGQWLRMSAKYFRPYSSEDVQKDLLEEALKNTNSIVFSEAVLKAEF